MSGGRGRVYVADDDAMVADALAAFLRTEGFEVESGPNMAGAVAALEGRAFDLVISDISMPGGDGFELLSVVRARFPDVPVILVTGYGTIESAVEAIRMGAYDYLTKPIVDDELRLVVDRALQQRALVRECRALREELHGRFGLGSVLGRDYRMRRVFELVEAVAESRANVLIEGASGTGKSLLARVVHERSDRRDGPFVEVSCGAIPEALLESELFGHVRGAFTGAVADKMGKFEAADGGTLFLDEIAAASPGLQVKLLRTVQSRAFERLGSNETREVDVRMLFATNIDLEAEVRAGRFRQDLFYRINVVKISLPPLHERIGDIPLLAERFLERFAADSKKSIAGFTGEAMAALQRYPWPGNVRELENVIERAVVLTRRERIDIADLPSHVPAACAESVAGDPYRPMTLKEALAEPERRIIEAALEHHGWNRQATAKALDINRTTLYKKMRRYGLVEPETGTAVGPNVVAHLR